MRGKRNPFSGPPGWTTSGFGSKPSGFGSKPSAFGSTASAFGSTASAFGSTNNGTQLFGGFSTETNTSTPAGGLFGASGSNKSNSAEKSVPLDFSIVTLSGACKVNHTCFKKLSGYLEQAHLADACMSEKIVISQAFGSLDQTVDFVHEKPIEFIDPLGLYEVASYLRIEKLLEKVGKDKQLASFLSSAGPGYFKRIYDMGGDIKMLLDAFPSIVEEFGIREIAKFPAPLIDIILLHEKVVITQPQKLELLNLVFDWKENPNHRLTKHLPLSCLTQDEVKHLLFHPKLNANTLRYLFLQANSMVTYRFTGDLFKGILAENKDNVTFIASSVASGPKSYVPENMLSEDPTEYFCTDTENGSPHFTMCFTGPVEVTDYSLQVWRLSANGVVPLSWELQGSMNKEDWSVIDSRENQTELMEENSVAKMYTVSGPRKAFSYIRFVQRATGNEGNTRLALARFELFGDASL